MKAFNRTSGKELAGKLSVATSVFSRIKGLIGWQALSQGEGLLIQPCQGVHTFFLRFPIDVIFLNKDNQIIEAVENLQPGRMTKLLLASMSVIELPSGTLMNSENVVGNEIVID